jgi:hypothetical protein
LTASEESSLALPLYSWVASESKSMSPMDEGAEMVASLTGSRLTEGGERTSALEAGDGGRSANDKERELENKGSNLTDGDREVEEVAILEDVVLGDEVRSITEPVRAPEKNVEGLLDLASPASANLCLAFVCEVSAGEVMNLRGQYLQSKLATGGGGAPGTLYFLLWSTIRWPCSRWDVNPGKFPSGRPREDACCHNTKVRGRWGVVWRGGVCVRRLTSLGASRFRFMKDVRRIQIHQIACGSWIVSSDRLFSRL